MQPYTTLRHVGWVGKNKFVFFEEGARKEVAFVKMQCIIKRSRVHFLVQN